MSLLPSSSEFVFMGVEQENNELRQELEELREENTSLKKILNDLTKDRDSLEAELMYWKAEFHHENDGRNLRMLSSRKK